MLKGGDIVLSTVGSYKLCLVIVGFLHEQIQHT